MVTYEITTLVQPHLVEAYERYMREHHIPEILVWTEIQAWGAAGA